MKKSVLILIIAMLLLTFGCIKGGIQGALIADLDKTSASDELTKQKLLEQSEEKNAAEMMGDLEESLEVKQEVKTGTFYGDIDVEGNGKDALKEKTRALFEKEFFDLNVKADTKFGPRYY